MLYCWSLTHLSRKDKTTVGHQTEQNSATCAGGHLNPAITLAFLLARKITAQRALCYWGAQVAAYTAAIKLRRRQHLQLHVTQRLVAAPHAYWLLLCGCKACSVRL